MKRILPLLVLLALPPLFMGCPSKSSPTSPGGSNAPANTPTETPLCNPYYSFGKSAVGAVNQDFNAGTLYCAKFTLSVAGSVYRLHAYIPSPSAGTTVQMALFTNNAGVSPNAPQSLLGLSPAQLPVQGWNTFDIPTTVLAAGTYWLAFDSGPYSPSGGMTLAMDNGVSGDSAADLSIVTPGSIPATLTGATAAEPWDFSFYADYCVSGSSPTPVPTVTLSPTPTFTPTFTFTRTVTPSNCTGSYSFGKNYLSGSSANGFSSGSITSSRFIIPVAGQVNTFHCYLLGGSSAGVSIRMALYTDNGGAPQSLLSQSNEQAAAANWNSFPILPVTVTAGGAYWLALMDNSFSPGVTFSLDQTTAGAGYNSFQSYGPFPAAFPGGGAANNFNSSFYADYCVGPGSPTPVPTITWTPTVTDTPTQTPVCANPTPLGVSAVQTPNQNYSGDNVLASSFTVSSSVYFVGNLHAYIPSPGYSGVTMMMALYTDNSGQPGNLLTQSAAQTMATGWNNCPISGTPLEPAGAYWIALISNDTVVGDYYSYSGSGTDIYRYNTGSDSIPFSFPSTLPAETLSSGTLDFYADTCP